jgi:hypothetical protein
MPGPCVPTLVVQWHTMGGVLASLRLRRRAGSLSDLSSTSLRFWTPVPLWTPYHEHGTRYWGDHGLHKMRLPLPVVSRKRRQASRGEIKITTVVGARETLDRHLSVSETQNRRPVSETWNKTAIRKGATRRNTVPVIVTVNDVTNDTMSAPWLRATKSLFVHTPVRHTQQAPARNPAPRAQPSDNLAPASL